MTIQQDEKIENVKEIFDEKIIPIHKEVTKKIAEINDNFRIEKIKSILENYSKSSEPEIFKVLENSAENGREYVSLWLIDYFNNPLVKNIPIEVRRDIARILMKTTNKIIKQKAIEFLSKPVINVSDNSVTTNVDKDIIDIKSNKPETLRVDESLSSKDSSFHDFIEKAEVNHVSKVGIELKEYILCLTLWIGGDGAIFNLWDLSQYLPYSEKDIIYALKELQLEKIIKKNNIDYSLTERGSILANSILIKIIVKWYNASEWVNNKSHRTIHHGFIIDKRNTAISNLLLGSRSFVTDYFQTVLENLVESYGFKKITFFSNFRRLLILISLNPTLEFLKPKSKEFSDVFSDFKDHEVLNIVEYNNEKLILIRNDFLMRLSKKGQNEQFNR